MTIAGPYETGVAYETKDELREHDLTYLNGANHDDRRRALDSMREIAAHFETQPYCKTFGSKALELYCHLDVNPERDMVDTAYDILKTKEHLPFGGIEQARFLIDYLKRSQSLDTRIKEGTSEGNIKLIQANIIDTVLSTDAMLYEHPVTSDTTPAFKYERLAQGMDRQEFKQLHQTYRTIIDTLNSQK